MIKRFYTVVKPFWFCHGAAINWLLLASTVGTTLGIVWVTVQYTIGAVLSTMSWAFFFAQASAWDLALHYVALRPSGWLGFGMWGS